MIPWLDLKLTWHHLGLVTGFVLGMVLVLRLLRQRQRPSVKIAWLLAMLALPYVAVPLYVLLSGRKIRGRIHKKAKLYLPQGPPQPGLGHPYVERLLVHEGLPGVSAHNRVDYLFEGHTAYHELCRILEEAKSTIHVAIFILARDDVGRDIIERLTRKAQEGVRVRLLLDALGCLTSRWDFVSDLRRAGGEVGIFNPVNPLQRRSAANLRNHRKLVVVDGAVAWTGGMNFAEEYLGPTERADRWIDAALLLSGPAVADIQDVFLSDWNFSTQQNLTDQDLETPALEAAGSAAVQVVASGPDVPDDAFYDALFASITEADWRVWLVTPYFVPDDTLVKAMALQSRMGADVRLILPLRSNHRITDTARTRFLRELSRAGVRIYLVPERMLHAKAMLFDRSVAVVGSANLDLRSLYLNFELSVFLHSEPEIDRLAVWMEELCAQAELYRPEPPTLVGGWIEDLSLLVSPLL